MPMDIALAFRCDACGYQCRLRRAMEDPTTSTGACPCCGGVQWHIYAKDDRGKVRVIA